MAPIFLAVISSLAVYILAVMFIPQRILYGSGAYTRHMLDRLRAASAASQGVVLEGAGRVADDPPDNPLVRAFLLLPGMDRAVPLIQRAGMWRTLDVFALAMLLVFLFFLLALARFGAVSLPLSAALTFLAGRFYLKRRVSRQRRAFLDLFPDALDSIVRSVRAGYPLGAAIAVVGDGMPAPLGPEFRRVADEAAYGWTLYEALARMAARVDEPDVRFFTIVLSVQQEAGGNLSEILSNLSGVLRKRKHLRLKIKALSSEGRTTAWILGSLPGFVFGVIYFIAPEHLQPLFDTQSGQMMLAGVVAMVAGGMLIVRQIVNMEI
jgi:tight adherence protein B